MQAEDYRKVPEVGVTNPTIDVLRTHLIFPPAVLDHSRDRCSRARSAC